jgi:hypothetical protein|tara:strand:- start:133 stop:372 length:240 start_codon:yes stop_codon:yes gene_type:complete
MALNNNETRDLLRTQQKAINRAINGLVEYEQQVVVLDRYRAADAAALMGSIKADAKIGGVDIDAWDGSVAPAPAGNGGL